eukprot:UN09069
MDRVLCFEIEESRISLTLLTYLRAFTKFTSYD